MNPFVYNNTSNENRFSVYLESPTSLYLQKFYGINKLGSPGKMKSNEGDNIDIPFNGSLREEQLPIENLYLENAKSKGGGIISLKCGGGKTVLALHIVSILKKKTIVHKDFLMTQWRDNFLFKNELI